MLFTHTKNTYLLSDRTIIEEISEFSWLNPMMS